MKKIVVTTILLFITAFVIMAQKDSFELTSVDIPPLFEGCDDPLISEQQRQACSVPKIQAFVHQNITYPDSARAKNIEGVVVVRFTVTETGKITALELIRDIGAGCGEEALRVVRMMPDFRPAQRAGEAVATKMTLPIRFKKIDEAQANNKNLYQVHWGTAYNNRITKNKLQELTKLHLIIRDYYGNLYDINFLTLTIKTKHKDIVLEYKGNNLSKDMLKALKKVRPGQFILISATILKDYKEIEVERLLEITK